MANIHTLALTWNVLGCHANPVHVQHAKYLSQPEQISGTSMMLHLLPVFPSPPHIPLAIRRFICPSAGNIPPLLVRTHLHTHKNTNAGKNTQHNRSEIYHTDTHTMTFYSNSLSEQPLFFTSLTLSQLYSGCGSICLFLNS